ncbi:MAG: hypothetical protein V3V12_06245 [Gammaproteobacteria bacterium]
MKKYFLVLVSMLLCSAVNASAFNPILEIEANQESALKPLLGPRGGDTKPRIIVIGEAITWKYTVTNDGRVPINNVTVTGRQKQPELGNWEPLCVIGTIAAGNTGFCEAFDQAAEGIHKILVAARGTTSAGEASSVSADAFYFGQKAYTRISVASDGSEGNGVSTQLSISADGQYIAFRSSASNLVPNDHNNVDDIFVHDQLSSETTRISVASDGAEMPFHSTNPSISGDGRYVSFTVDNDQRPRVPVTHIHDRVTGETRFLAYGNLKPIFNYDGRFIVFKPISNIDPVTGQIHYVKNRDILVHDQLTSETTPVTATIDDAFNNSFPSISDDGRYILFLGFSRRTTNLFVYDQTTGETMPVTVTDSYAITSSISRDGDYITFINYSTSTLTVYNRVAGETVLSLPVDAEASNPSFTLDNRFIIYEVPKDTSIQFYSLNRVTGEKTLLDELPQTYNRQISSDGNSIALVLLDNNLVPDDTIGTDVFVYRFSKPSPPTPEPEPALTIQTRLNAQDTRKPGPTVSAGTNLTWTYTAKNDGNTTLQDVQILTRQKLPVVGPWEIACTLGAIESGKSASCEVFDLAIENTYKALTVVRGTTSTGDIIESSSIAFYKGEQGSVPALSLEVTTNGLPTAKPGSDLTQGTTIDWRYSVTNDGQTVLNNVVIRGRQKLPALGNWESLCTIASIQPGTTGNCTTTSTAISGIYKALIVARTANVESTADVFYRGQATTMTPQLALSLSVTANGSAIEKPGALIPTGSTVNWTYTVTNEGNAPLHNILITQRQKLPSLGEWGTPCSFTILAPGATESCSATTTAITDNYKALIVARSTLDNSDNIEDKVDAFYRH